VRTSAGLDGADAFGRKRLVADEELAIAQKLQSDGKHELAYARFKQVAKSFPDTPAANIAGDAVAKYEQDPAFVKRANETAAGGKAKGTLNLAQSYRNAGRREQARAKYREVIDSYPGTSYAETAARELAAMGK